MKTIAYGAFLVLLLLASVILLRSIEPGGDEESLPRRLAALVGEGTTTLDLGQLEHASAAELFALGVDYQQFWRVRDATELFERAVAADSTHHGAWRKLVECYTSPLVANQEAAKHALERAMLTAPTPADTVLIGALRMLYDQCDYASAIAALSGLVREKNPPADARYHLAMAYFVTGRLNEAAKHLDPLMQADATVGPVAELSIRRAAAARDYEAASDAARELARLYAEEPFPYVLIAQVELARGRRESAIEFCGNALSLDPRCVPAIMTRAFLYAEEGELETARVSFEKLQVFEDTMLRSIGHEGIAFVDFLGGDFEAGVDEMDESIRHAMMTGSTRRGLQLAVRLVEYLCQLGQADRAEAVAERWVTGFGEIPMRLARARIQLLRGDLESASDVVERLETDKEWVLWARRLGIDIVELSALTEIGRQRPVQALTRLETDRSGTPVTAGALARRAFLAGFASFENGDAESAARSFGSSRQRMYGLEFPGHGDPVLYIQSLFFLAESDLARGGHAAARGSYEAFLGYWGEAAWDLEAVARARKKIEALGETSAPPQG
jgi:tetratricopeptide (TPR) repeat protein